MERTNTDPLFSQEIYNEILHSDSFNEQFNSNVFHDIMPSPQHLSETSCIIEEHSLGCLPGWMKKNGSSLSQPLKKQFDSDESNDAGAISSENFFSTEGCQDVSPDSFFTKEATAEKRNVYIEHSTGDIDDSLFVKEEAQSFLIISENEDAVSLPSLSLEPWSGEVDFRLKIDSDKHGTSKWCFNSQTSKLYCAQNVSIPVQVCVYSWDDAYINITPVYKSSQYHNIPVTRCHIHKMQDQDRQAPFPEHIVQVDNIEAQHTLLGERHSVNVPLGHPAPGETSKIIFIQCGCLNTCVGGPGRRPFSIIFTLFNRQGTEIGRQILDLKVCSCPFRDMKTDNSRKKIEGNDTKKKKIIGSTIGTLNKATKRPRLEGEEAYEKIMVPSIFAGDVKRYINQLLAERYMKQNTNFKFPHDV